MFTSVEDNTTLVIGNGKVGIGTNNPSEKLEVVGNICHTGNHLVSSTTGEVATATYLSGSFQLTQGFQQSDDIINNVDELLNTVNFKFFPNPTNGNSILELKMPASSDLIFDIQNITGQSIMKIERAVFEGSFSQNFDLNELAIGTYFIKISNTDAGIIKTIKFVKI